VAYVILSFHRAHGFAQGLMSARSKMRDDNLPKDVVRWEARHASNEEVRTRREGEQVQASPVGRQRSVCGGGGGWTPPLDLGPPSEGEEEGEITSPPLSSLCCHTPFLGSGNEASIRVPRMFHSHV
jgi:hypothetical protein